jgi:hypothetical protein
MSLTGLGEVFSFADKVLTRIFPDPKDRLDAQTKLLELQQTGELAALAAETDLAKGQQNINLEEAKHENLFVSGWRPFIGWICGLAFMYHFILQPFMVFMYSLNGTPIKLPEFDMNALFTVLMGMLGLGGLRTLEKVKGTK